MYPLSGSNWRDFLRHSIIALFTLFLVLYICVLIVLVLRLKKYFPKYFMKEKGKIIISTGGISVAIITRISTNIWYSYCKEDFNVSYNTNTWLFPIYQMINAITVSTPLGTTLISMIYAYRQKKKLMNLENKNYDPRISSRCPSEMESVRALMEQHTESIFIPRMSTRSQDPDFRFRC